MVRLTDRLSISITVDWDVKPQSKSNRQTNPYINKAIYILLMHGFGTLNTLVSGHHIFTTADQLIALVWPFSLWFGPGKRIVEFMQSYDQTSFFCNQVENNGLRPRLLTSLL